MSQLAMMYVLPLILGRTFDYNRMQVGVDIFPSNETANPMKFSNILTESSYTLIESPSHARAFLRTFGVSKLFNLKADAGLLQTGVIDSYLKEPFDRQNTVEQLIYTKTTLDISELNFDAQPLSRWQHMQGLGTHFVRSITYGQEMIASVRFTCNGTENKNRLKSALRRVQVYGFGRQETQVMGMTVDIDKYSSDLADAAESVQIKVFSSVPLKVIPTDMDALSRLIKSEFREAAEKYNHANGVPIMVRLSPLTELDWTRPDFDVNRELEFELDEFELQFSDLLNTRAAIEAWMKGTKQELSADLEKKVYDLYKSVQFVLQTYYEAIGELDMSKGPEQLSYALKNYGDSYLNNIYYFKYLRLRKEVESNSS